MKIFAFKVTQYYNECEVCVSLHLYSLQARAQELVLAEKTAVEGPEEEESREDNTAPIIDNSVSS